MARARIVSPPPQDYIPEPLVTPPIIEQEVIVEEPSVTESIWEDGNYAEEIIVEPSPEEIEQERIAQEKYEQLQQQKLASEQQAKEAEELLTEARRIIENPPVVIETVIETVVETVHVQDPDTLKELEILRRENEQLTRIKEAAEKAKEEKILAARNKMTEQKGNQLNLVKQRKTSLLNRLKEYLKNRRVKKATTTTGSKNYETAILQRARIAVPKMLDDIEKIHEELVILEELLAKYVVQKK